MFTLRTVGSVLVFVLVTAPVFADEVDDYVRAVMEKQRIPGLSLAIVKDGAPLKLRGYGLANVELGVVCSLYSPATSNTLNGEPITLVCSQSSSLIQLAFWSEGP